ncbi:MAG: aldolase [Terracidiphilus sp.]|jgi:hypothetical protein
MMTIEEIELAGEVEKPLDFSRHSLEVPEVLHREMFYPLGFPTALATNSLEILSQARDLWGIFEKQFDTKPIRVDVHVVEGDAVECPPAPAVRIMLPLLIGIADSDNYSITNLDACTTQIALSRATLRHRSYLNYFLLGSAPLCHIATRHATPVHAGCVAFEGRGMLLCGDSGAGKSSLSYACARARWTYVSDDASFLLNDGKDRLVTGNCHQVRFRPSAAELFPEVKGLEITPRAAGKPSIELPTAFFPEMICAQTTRVDFLVFLNRRAPGPAELVTYRKDVARHSMRQVLYGSPESLAVQYAALERLLAAELFELRYSNLDWAVQRLETLARKGR